MPAFNAAPFIGRAISSVQAQTFADWELVVVDDGSSDDTAAVVARQAGADSRIRLVVRDGNSGCAFIPRLEAVRAARAAIIAPLDADDTVPPDYLARLMALKRDTGAQIVYPTVFLSASPGEKPRRYLPADGIAVGRAYAGRELVRETMPVWRIGAAGGVIDRDLMLRAAASATDTAYVSSDEFLARVLLAEAPTVALSDAPYYYLKHSGSVTAPRPGHELAARLDALRCADNLVDYFTRAHGSEDEAACRAHALRYHAVVALAAHLVTCPADGRRPLPEAVPESGAMTARDILRRAFRRIDWRAVRPYVSGPLSRAFRLGLRPALALLHLRLRLRSFRK